MNESSEKLHNYGWVTSGNIVWNFIPVNLKLLPGNPSNYNGIYSNGDKAKIFISAFFVLPQFRKSDECILNFFKDFKRVLCIFVKNLLLCFSESNHWIFLEFFYFILKWKKTRNNLNKNKSANWYRNTFFSFLWFTVIAILYSSQQGIN